MPSREWRRDRSLHYSDFIPLDEMLATLELISMPSTYFAPLVFVSSANEIRWRFPEVLLIEQGSISSILNQLTMNLELGDGMIQEVWEESSPAGEEHVEKKEEVLVGIGNGVHLNKMMPEDMSEEESKDISGEAESGVEEIEVTKLLGAFLVVGVEYSG